MAAEIVARVVYCISAHHVAPVPATMRAYMPVGPGEYCEPCGQWMLQVHEALGCHVHTERIEAPTLPAPRAIRLED